MVPPAVRRVSSAVVTHEPEISAVGGTALIIANCRARLSRVAQPWFVDPLALHLSSQHPDWDEWPISPGLLAWVAVRTRFLDELILDTMNDRVGQVVILGAGLDARAFRLPVDASVRVFEVDRADVLDVKEDTVRDAGLRSPGDRRVVVADLVVDDWRGVLTSAGWDRRWAPSGSPRDCSSISSRRSVKPCAAKSAAPDHRMTSSVRRWRPASSTLSSRSGDRRRRADRGSGSRVRVGCGRALDGRGQRGLRAIHHQGRPGSGWIDSRNADSPRNTSVNVVDSGASPIRIASGSR